MKLTPWAATIVIGCMVASCAKPIAPAPKLRAGDVNQVGLHPTNYGTFVVPVGAVITVWGDGCRPPFPAAGKSGPPSLSGALAKATDLKIIDRTKPNEDAASGPKEMHVGELGNLAVLCFGWSDANGGTGDISAAISQMVALTRDKGVPTMVILAPVPAMPTKPKAVPTKDQLLVARLVAINGGVSAAATGAGAIVIDAQSVLGNEYSPTDKLRLSHIAMSRIAHAIANRIELAEGK